MVAKSGKFFLLAYMGNIKIHTHIITQIFPWEPQIYAWSVQEDNTAVTESRPVIMSLLCHQQAQHL